MRQAQNYSNLALMKRDHNLWPAEKKVVSSYLWQSLLDISKISKLVYLRSFSFNRSFNFLWNLTKKPKMYLKTIYYDKHN